jgi:hypothetical protein
MTKWSRSLMCLQSPDVVLNVGDDAAALRSRMEDGWRPWKCYRCDTSPRFAAAADSACSIRTLVPKDR